MNYDNQAMVTMLMDNHPERKKKTNLIRIKIQIILLDKFYKRINKNS